MATQLTRRNWRLALASSAPAINVTPRYAALAAAGVIALVYAAVFASMRTSGQEHDAAETRYLNASQLLQVPPVPVATLEADLAAAQYALGLAKNAAAPPSIDPASDDATALLIRRAQEAGLAVTSVTRLDDAQTKVDTTMYDVASLRMSLRGAAHDTIIAFLQSQQATDPGLVPTLTSLTVESGGVTAEIVFSMYARVEPTPVAGAAGAAR